MYMYVIYDNILLRFSPGPKSSSPGAASMKQPSTDSKQDAGKEQERDAAGTPSTSVVGDDGKKGRGE